MKVGIPQHAMVFAVVDGVLVQIVLLRAFEPTPRDGFLDDDLLVFQQPFQSMHGGWMLFEQQRLVA